MIRWLTSLVLAASVCHAENPLETKLKKKLSQPFLKKAAWVLDYDDAKEDAKESGKFIFAYFSRSFAP